VETTEQLVMAAELGCTYAQGFTIARPMPAGDLVRWLGPRRGMPVRVPQVVAER
jgi:EAL domain-containing protein (putative c-di-GMP-specific phosphodiesterase class I)